MEGLIELNNFISADEEQTLLENIDKCAWNTSLSRRTQHYGYVYNYSKGGSLTSATAIPEWMDYLIERLSSHISQPINQAIINEYNPGQGIAPHIDAKTFGDTIVSISLGSKCIMEFTKDGEKIEKILNRQSCIVLKGDSRNDWKHSIPARKSDVINGVKTNRNRRVSITFRHVLEH